MSIKVFLVLSQTWLCPFPPFCNPHSGLIIMILKNIVSDRTGNLYAKDYIFSDFLAVTETFAYVR